MGNAATLENPKQPISSKADCREERSEIVAIDDDAMTIHALRRLIPEKNYAFLGSNDAQDGLKLISEKTAVVLLDLDMPQISGWECLNFVRQQFPHVQVIVLTGSSQISDAVEAIRGGAFQYVTKPFDRYQLIVFIEKAVAAWRAARRIGVLEESHSHNIPPRFARSSGAYADELTRQIDRIANLDSTVFIGGESGTGKSTVARMIHRKSRRADGPFVTVNCASLPRDLIHSELFGHTKGSFTGAVKDRLGHVEVADGGTLFLDEIGDLPLELQPKLLTFLQDKIIQRLGTTESKRVDVRLIVATHRDLGKMCREQLFREDLYYRLMVLGINLQPLRQRLDELPSLVEEILTMLCERMEVEQKTLATNSMARLLAHNWPGNIRELENVLERAVAFSSGEAIVPNDLLFYRTSENPFHSGGFVELDREDSEKQALAVESNTTYGELGEEPTEICDSVTTNEFDLVGKTLDEIEREAISRTLVALRGNKARAARSLGISEKSIYNKMQRLGLRN